MRLAVLWTSLRRNGLGWSVAIKKRLAIEIGIRIVLQGAVWHQWPKMTELTPDAVVEEGRQGGRQCLEIVPERVVGLQQVREVDIVRDTPRGGD